MFEQELREAIEMLSALGPDAPATRKRIALLHYEYSIRRQILGAEPSDGLKKIGAFLDSLKPLGLLAGFPNCYRKKLSGDDLRRIREHRRFLDPQEKTRFAEGNAPLRIQRRKRKTSRKPRKKQLRLIYTPMGGQPK